MENLQSIEPMTAIIIIAACAIIVLALCAKFIRGLLKIAIITSMIACILYFLREAGII
ncbi:MAG TPA: hypothetical protein VLL07_01230 [Pontiella sp.]|nr:hypothetical protein [Pontiella sp.]